ncbi:MAG TPA: phytanoyl-CoA dioxygenase family protein [Planctomycetota bacterium]|nr:phytanoyl-CoA dioxygenase family protein [Planctomycetota bacterium]
MAMATATDPAHATHAATYRRDGFVIVRGLLAPDQVDEVRRRLLARLDGDPTLDVQWEPGLEQRDDLPRSRRARAVFHLCHRDAWFMAHALRPEIVDVVAALIGPAVTLYTDQTFVKGAYSGSEVAFHQDAAYWPFDPPAAVTCWLALDASTRENGCVRFVPGTHDSARPHARLAGPQALGVDPSWAERAQPVELAPGDACFHHALAVHGSEANRSARSRLGMALIYLPTSCRLASPFDHFPYPFVRARGPRHDGGMPTA